MLVTSHSQSHLLVNCDLVVSWAFLAFVLLGAFAEDSVSAWNVLVPQGLAQRCSFSSQVGWLTVPLMVGLPILWFSLLVSFFFSWLATLCDVFMCLFPHYFCFCMSRPFDSKLHMNRSIWLIHSVSLGPGPKTHFLNKWVNGQINILWTDFMWNFKYFSFLNNISIWTWPGWSVIVTSKCSWFFFSIDEKVWSFAELQDK